jgi:hypothetical protein
VGGEEHVLGGPAGVEGERALAGDDHGDHERRAPYVARSEHAFGQPVAPAAVLHDEEAPRLAVARIPGEPARVEDPPLDVGRDRTPLVVPHLAPGDDGEERLHRRPV